MGDRHEVGRDARRNQQHNSQTLAGTLVVPVYMEAEAIAASLTEIADHLGGSPGGVDWDLVISMLQAKRYFEETFTGLATVSGSRPMPPVSVSRHPAGQLGPDALPSPGQGLSPEAPDRSVQIRAEITESRG